MKNKKRFFNLLVFIFAALAVCFDVSSLPAFQPEPSFNEVFGQAPPRPAADIEALLGRYENINDARDSFIALEDSGVLKILRDGKYYNLSKINGMRYSAGDSLPGGIRSVEFYAPVRSARFHCKVNGTLYRQVVYGSENGGTYKIKPLKPIGELKRAALSARPPREADATCESELVDLKNLGGNLIFDIRYASENNFMGAKFYDSPGAFLQKPAAYGLLYVARALERHGLAMIVYDAYRPWYVTKMFYDATPDAQKNFVADPSKGSRHNRGTAVDVGLYDLKTGKLIEMGSGYDEFSERASPKFEGATSNARWHRKLLERYMNKAGFTVYEDEWWHFDYKLGIVKYPLMNETFEKLTAGKIK
ncbi:MAG TPA: M15 family metallopeptidase [Candidatus Wallbacteria bacterium]|nr:M15 family metallopeptidase [Candidatus Wallbacteria bacterium]